MDSVSEVWIPGDMGIEISVLASISTHKVMEMDESSRD